MSARPEATLKSNSYEIKLTFILLLPKQVWSQCDNITEIFQFIYIDDVILRQPEVRLSTTTFEILKWFGQELTEFLMDKSKDKERINMNFTCIACYCVTFTYKLKFAHNFWTACPIWKIFSTSCSGNVLSFTASNAIIIWLKLKKIWHSKMLIMQYLEK